MAEYFDRYKNFRVNGGMKPLPFIPIPSAPTDKTMIYKKGQTRLDKLSDDYYNNPYSGMLILSANAEYGGLEFLIPDMTLLRIPFPFDSAVSRYITEISKHKQLYGE